MKVANPLTIDFIAHYPVEAARVLEQVSAENVAALLVELSPAVAAPVLTAMLPDSAAACLEIIAPVQGGKLLSDIPASYAARIYRVLSVTKQQALAAQMPDKARSSMLHYLEYAAISAGDLMDVNVSMLPGNITVAEALRRIERYQLAVNCEIYIVDDTHHLLGVIELGRLLVSKRSARLCEVMNPKAQPLAVIATAETLLSHPGWATHRRLPVVERDDILVGVLSYTELQNSLAATQTSGGRDPLDNLLSVAGLYWLSLAQLLDSLMRLGGTSKGERL